LRIGCRYSNQRKFPFHKNLRKLLSEIEMIIVSYYLLDYFGINSFEYGNWLTQKDRYIYLSGAGLALYDLAKIIKVDPKKLGFKGRLNITFGSRGVPNSLAHFEPANFLINITRHREGQSYNSSGGGSLGHEWGHALDFYAGNFLSKQFYRYATQNTNNGVRPSGVVGYYYDFMIELCGPQNKSYQFTEPTQYILKLQKWCSENMGEDLAKYYLSNAEIFARSMESYLNYKCNVAGIKETFLKKYNSEYLTAPYPDHVTIKRLAPLMDKLILETMKLIK